MALAARDGFAGVEWLDRLLPSWQASDLRRLGASAQAQGLTANALSLCLEVQAPPAGARALQKQALALVEQAALLGTSVVRVAIGGGGALSLERILLHTQGARLPWGRGRSHLGLVSRWVYLAMLNLPAKARAQAPPPAPRSQLERAAELLHPLAQRCAQLGLTLGLENHFGLTSHAPDTLSIIEQCGSGLGVCLDLGNFFGDQDAPTQIQLLAPRAVHVHFKTQEPNPITQAPDLAQGLECLRQCHYQGMFSAEYLGPGSGLGRRPGRGRFAGKVVSRRWSLILDLVF